jgi:hypothetical protein
MCIKPLRQTVDKLTAADFERSPVWEFALDEEGEEGRTRRPFVRTSSRVRWIPRKACLSFVRI